MQTPSPAVIAQQFALTDLPLFTPCHHIASSQSVAAVLIESGVRNEELAKPF
jgi:rhodanese-related sulfurtransferase